MKQKLVSAILTIVLGIGICIAYMVIHISKMHQRYLKGHIAEKGLFDSFKEYFLNGSKLEIAIFIAGLIICVLCGICLIERSLEFKSPQNQDSK